MINFNIPTTITQGDRVTWKEVFLGDLNVSDELKFYLRGSSVLDVIGSNNGEGWDFEITSAQSKALNHGKYKAQVVFYRGGNPISLKVIDLEVLISFEDLTELDPRSPDEIELEAVTKAIAAVVSGGTAEYRIGDRMVRYQDLAQLTERQRYLRNRIAKTKNPGSIGGRNVGVRFSNG